jgi:hypothetical protein
VESADPYLIPDFRRNDFSYFPLSMILAIGLSYTVFIVLRNICSISSLIIAFIMKRHCICQKPFLHLFRFFLCSVLYLLIYIGWAILQTWDEIKSIFLMCLLKLFIYSHVYTLFGSFLPPATHSHSFLLSPSLPGRSCSALITNFVEEKT